MITIKFRKVFIFVVNAAAFVLFVCLFVLFVLFVCFVLFVLFCFGFVIAVLFQRGSLIYIGLRK